MSDLTPGDAGASMAIPVAATGPVGSVAGGDERLLDRLRWRCRRGRLENDLVLARFLDARAATLGAGDVAALEALLALSDDELWDVLCGRAEPADAALAPVVASLRSV